MGSVENVCRSSDCLVSKPVLAREVLRLIGSPETIDGNGRAVAVGRRASIRWRLIELSMAILAPFLVITTFLAFRYADSEQRVLEAKRFDHVNNLTFLIDGEVKAVMAVLKMLSAAPSLQNGDFATFRIQADAAIGGNIALLAVLDEQGQQLLSTAVPAGQPLPVSANMFALAEVFLGKTIVSDVLMGTVARRPVISIAAPVTRDGRVAYVLSAVVFPEIFADQFSVASVNPAWAAAVVDRNGAFVTRNLDLGKYIGRPARPELRAVARGKEDIGTFDNTTYEGVLTGNSFRRSSVSGWTSIVSVPKEVLLAPFRQTLAWVSAFALTLSLGGLAFATMLAKRISTNIQQFGEAAGHLLEGRPLPAVVPYLAELQDVRRAYEHAETVATARSIAESRVHILLQELTHRSKNLLSVTQAIANLTGRSAGSVSDFLARYNERLRALAASHDFLFNEGGESAQLDRLVQEHVAPFSSGTDRVDVSCPGISVKPDVVQFIGMALHELATNAAKYGALSGPAGRISVASHVECGEAGRPLRLDWIESGGPPVQTPKRKGFGSVVLERMVAQSVNGRADLRYDPDGFKWSLTIAAEHYELASETGQRRLSPASRETDAQ